MSETTEFDAEIDALAQQIAALRERRTSLLQARAESLCPYKVGDETTTKGWSHHNKPCVIDKIYCLDGQWRGDRWSVAATVLKKDGSRSKIETRWYEDHEQRSKA